MSDNKSIKQYWEMSYDELYNAWAARYSFNAKGEMTESEARAFHRKWKALGKAAKNGTL